MTGLELQTRLAKQDGPPINFLTGHGDIPTTVKSMKGGATEFLLKPFEEDDLVRVIDAAIAFDRSACAREREEDSLRDFKSRYQRVRFFLMRQVLHMLSATVFLLLGSAGQADKPEREASLIQRFSSADLGGRGQPGGQRSADRLWHGSLGAAPTECAANTI
jgi:DNA-binding response OmpR family regulator